MMSRLMAPGNPHHFGGQQQRPFARLSVKVKVKGMGTAQVPADGAQAALHLAFREVDVMINTAFIGRPDGLTTQPQNCNATGLIRLA